MSFRLKLLSMRNKNRWHLEAIAVLGNVVHSISQKAASACRGALNFDQSCALNNDQGT